MRLVQRLSRMGLVLGRVVMLGRRVLNRGEAWNEPRRMVIPLVVSWYKLVG